MKTTSNSKTNTVYTTVPVTHGHESFVVGFNGYNDPIHIEVNRGGATGVRTWWCVGEPRTELVEKLMTLAILKMF